MKVKALMLLVALTLCGLQMEPARAGVTLEDFGKDVEGETLSTGAFCTTKVKMAWSGDKAFRAMMLERKVPMALYDEGFRRLLGYGMPQDVVLGKSYLEEAIKKEAGEAAYLLGRFALLNPTPEALTEADAYFTKAVRLGCPEGYFGLSLLASGAGRMEEAARYAGHAAELGSSLGELQTLYLSMPQDEEPTEKNLTRQIEAFEGLRAKGNPFVEPTLSGLMIERIKLIGKKEEFKVAIQLLVDAAKRPWEGEQIFMLGDVYYNLSVAFARSDAKGAYQAAVRGACLKNPQAMVAVAQMKAVGAGTEKNLALAGNWVKAAGANPTTPGDFRKLTDKMLVDLKAFIAEKGAAGAKLELLPEAGLPAFVYQQCAPLYPAPK